VVRLAWRAAERWYLGGWARARHHATPGRAGRTPAAGRRRCSGRRSTWVGKWFFAQNRRFGRANHPFLGCFRMILVSWLPCTYGFAAGPMRPCPYRSPALCGPSVAVLTADLPCQARWDALDGLTVAATLAHEL